jgi:hypothetical protein
MIAAVLLLLAVADPISLAEYRDRLAAIRGSLDRKDLDEARRGAKDLQSLRVRHEGMEFPPDRAVLGPIADARDLASAQVAAAPLRAMTEALDSVPAPPKSAPDAALLEKLRQEEEAHDPAKSGPAGGPRLHQPRVPDNLLEWVRQLASDFWEALQTPFKRFFTWLIRMFFGSAASGLSGAKTQVLVIGLVALILGVVALVAFVTLRRRAPAEEEIASVAPAKDARDEDPLSRSSNEWERFAADLMKGARYREAIRAWYHAVLVTVFRAGLLHYRKDRTNWEYAYALAPTLAWRSGFLDATRTFEYEWYGRRDTARETAEAFASSCRRMLDRIHEGRAA